METCLSYINLGYFLSAFGSGSCNLFKIFFMHIEPDLLSAKCGTLMVCAFASRLDNPCGRPDNSVGKHTYNGLSLSDD